MNHRKTYPILIICLFLALELFPKKTVYRVYFQNDSAELDTTALQVIDSVRTFCNTYDVYAIYVLGYCNDLGSVALNDTLSGSRARAVSQKINKPTLIKVSEGRGAIPWEPFSPLSLDKQKIANRVVEVSISYTTKESERISMQTYTEDSARIKRTAILLGKPISELNFGESFKLKNLHFEGSRHVLLPHSVPILEELVEILSLYSELEIEIQGHICCTNWHDALDIDTETYDLSVRRARMVYEYLIEHGIEKSRLSYIGLGSKYRTAAMNPEDRRVVIRIKNIGRGG